jgi:hypothetical protein
MYLKAIRLTLLTTCLLSFFWVMYMYNVLLYLCMLYKERFYVFLVHCIYVAPSCCSHYNM